MSDETNAKSVVKVQHPASARKVNKVPYVELHGGRVQGVVSSGSDASRVYVSFFDAGTTNYYCSTNNNRPCGGLRGGPCKHLKSLMDEAVLQYGAPKVGRYLKLGADPASLNSSYDIMRHVTGAKTKEEASLVFSRFLSYLRYVEYEGTPEPMPEMAWFTVG
jgi:hypothetical protein